MPPIILKLFSVNIVAQVSVALFNLFDATDTSQQYTHCHYYLYPLPQSPQIFTFTTHDITDKTFRRLIMILNYWSSFVISDYSHSYYSCKLPIILELFFIKILLIIPKIILE